MQPAYDDEPSLPAKALPIPAPQGRRLNARYSFERYADGGIDPGEVADLWIREGALGEEKARERVGDVVICAVDRDDGVVGVSTAWLQDNGHLGMRMWNYRTFVARAHRQGDIAFLLLHVTRDELAERYASGADTRASGILMEVQNEVLKRTRNRGMWETSRFAFIGEDERGAHHRVFYFPGAEAPATR